MEILRRFIVLEPVFVSSEAVGDDQRTIEAIGNVAAWRCERERAECLNDTVRNSLDCPPCPTVSLPKDRDLTDWVDVGRFPTRLNVQILQVLLPPEEGEDNDKHEEPNHCVMPRPRRLVLSVHVIG